MKPQRMVSSDVSRRKGLPVLDDPGLQAQQEEFDRKVKYDARKINELIRKTRPAK
jgi:hypothetical protein